MLSGRFRLFFTLKIDFESQTLALLVLSKINPFKFGSNFHYFSIRLIWQLFTYWALNFYKLIFQVKIDTLTSRLTSSEAKQSDSSSEMSSLQIQYDQQCQSNDDLKAQWSKMNNFIWKTKLFLGHQNRFFNNKFQSNSCRKIAEVICFENTHKNPVTLNLDTQRLTLLVSMAMIPKIEP